MSLSVVRRLSSSMPLSTSLHPVIDRVYRNRNVTSMDELEVGLKALAHFNLLKGIDDACSVMVDAFRRQKKLVIVGDFDADGATSTAICMLALRDMGLQNVSYLVPNRFDFGYGLSEPLVELAAQQGAQVILTVDSGIACHAGVNRANELDIEVIITDHHLPGEFLPAAKAIVNPNQPDCAFPSKSLAGVGVAFYLMLALRAKLTQVNWFSTNHITPPNLAELLDIVAVGTVADVVNLDSNNRILVHQGLQRIRSGYCRPGIKSLVEIANRQLRILSASDLGFVVAPRLNAAGRLDDMGLGIECLLSEDISSARTMAARLDELNQERKEIEHSMRQDAEKIVASFNINEQINKDALVIYQKDFHQGVIGIVAGRIKEQFLVPTIAFALQDEETLKGSARSINGFHIRDVLEEVNSRHPHLITKFGGHAMAAGLSIPLQHLSAFTEAFQQVSRPYLEALPQQDSILSDGELDDKDFDLLFAHELNNAGPFGQGFDAPRFDGVFTLVAQRIVGQKHLKFTCRLASGKEVDGIAFNIDPQVWPDTSVKKVQLVYQLDINVFRNQETVQLLAEHITPYA
ncbi:single-stranded-DNA-specific exonuclease RecJ [Alteromonas sp. ASW11-130]|uniref:single-stranded-DNA-specific exonuclease RecJ n=1 Tax=Alteromonas sp. ASW11-130 TaxID=3015775 RepID=UPI00224217EC|nr:single-stranded-DNA-specific exonuclease RecJ [Alteromonas sp. ASW11-130]MCW8090474.1 single-stranded-DNA-specific exonuclease RecJ [Alteromonas sp. ASW11-130]